ncbi:MAG: N-acetylmuramoyl-L-alanine amidase [Alistipes sp.]|nr:N-acetylmuramoyl-L-alanine amidase [Alistipes sp.]
MKHILFCLLLLFGVVMNSTPLLAQDNGAGVRVIVIDAGHGGAAFPGAVYGGVKEKDINLAVALKLGALIEKELPSIKVVYTRKTDTALGKTLNEDLTARANIANKAEGDFFISIHANAARTTTVKGAETLIMGESEKETRYNESALYDNNKDELIDMSDENTAAMVRAYIQNLQFTYGEYSEMMARIMQSQYQKGGRTVRPVKRQLLKVLYATDMPSVLTELGFMTNKTELAYMNSEKGQAAYARMLCDAVKEYVGHINRMAGVDTVIVESKAEEQTAAKEEPKKAESASEQPRKADAKKAESVAAKATAKETVKEQAAKSAEGYAIQLLASDKRVNGNDQQFKSYRGKVECYEGGGVLKYKYCYGEYKSREEAQRNLSTIRRTFKDAFVVHYKDGRIVK